MRTSPATFENSSISETRDDPHGVVASSCFRHARIFVEPKLGPVKQVVMTMMTAHPEARFEADDVSAVNDMSDLKR